MLTGRVACKNTFLKPLSPEEEALCFSQLEKGDKMAEEKLIKHNLRLVAHIVKKYTSPNFDKDELISVGSIGLMKAVKSYNSQKGNSFSTYAARCIQNEILMLLRSQKKWNNQISIEEKIGCDKEGNELSLIDILQDNSQIEEHTHKKLQLEKIKNHINKNFSKREKEIMILRYSLDGGVALTQNEVAKVLGISRSYISRIEKKCIQSLKQELSQA